MLASRLVRNSLKSIVTRDGDVLFGEIEEKATPRRWKMPVNGGFAPAPRATSRNVTLPGWAIIGRLLDRMTIVRGRIKK
jgi:hypothetical protein